MSLVTARTRSATRLNKCFGNSQKNITSESRHRIDVQPGEQLKASQKLLIFDEEKIYLVNSPKTEVKVQG